MSDQEALQGAQSRPRAREEQGRNSSALGVMADRYLGLIEEVSTGSNDNVYDSNSGRAILHDAFSAWLSTSRKWLSFWTLTVKDPRPVDVVDRYFRRLIQVLNSRAFGSRYPRTVGHSYFSYVKGTEYQIRDVVHFHVIVDQPINYEVLHSYWNRSMGFVWADRILDVSSAANYVSKITRYVRKKGDVDLYFREQVTRPPEKLPSWWQV